MNREPVIWDQSMNAEGWVPVVIELVEHVHDGSRIGVDYSTHDSFELAAIKQGHASYSFTGGRSVLLNPGDMMIIRPRVSHRFAVEGRGACDIVVLRFKFADAAGREISEPSLHDFLSFLEGQNPADGEYLPVSTGLWSDVARQVNRILAEQRQQREGHEYMTRLLVLELFVLISRAMRSQWEIAVEPHGTRISEYMRNARRYIEENCGEELSLRQIAGYVYLSPSYFVRAFKEAWGQSPMHYLQQVRLAKAQEMLSCSDLSIRDVAQKAGFSDQRRMNELFMKSLGVSPMKYRRQSGQG
jgi:AraC-like DNA-binding protein